jgi:hypothetical protein
VESALKLDEPVRLDGLGLMLGAIRVEFADYKLTKASIPSLSRLSNSASVPYTDTETCAAGELLGNGIGHS